MDGVSQVNGELERVVRTLPADLPENIRAAQLAILSDLGVSPADSKTIANSVMMMSDFYAKNPEKSSPWNEPWAQIAYVAYYMPLNWWRLCGVVSRGQQLNFFAGFDHYVDFGSGLGSLGFAFDQAEIEFKSALCLERSKVAVEMHRKLSGLSRTPIEWSHAGGPTLFHKKTLAAFSYSFTELEKLPGWVDSCDGVFLVEPSTKNDSRRLQVLRGELLAKGWHVWGPCTHAGACPLLTQSERDWCHDRFQWQQPDWLKAIEHYMPIKNGTLPCSWLMMKKNPPPSPSPNLARMTGDLQEFKGFAKQLICRGEDREFVAWQKRDFKKDYPEIGRGELVKIDSGIAVKSNELRPKSANEIEPI